MHADPRRAVPATDVLLADPRLQQLETAVGRARVRGAVREVQQRVRDGEVEVGAIVETVLRDLPPRAASLRRVLNATGVVLHTNLGRAPLSEAARHAVAEAAGYVDVEFDLQAGVRAPRGRGALSALRLAIPDAEDVMVVNNGAAGLLLAVTALASGREVIWSRGEMVEIGDGFRLPDLVASAGAVVREIGTTNRTSRDDYLGAVDMNTGCILKVHPSNFRMAGFTASAAISELCGLGVPLVVDLGAGLLQPEPQLPDEPDVAATLRAGADLVIVSGDKLLGGPQAGILAGRGELIRRLRRHPMARALRVDKLTLAALEASVAGPPTPTAAALHVDDAVLRRRAEGLAAELGHGAEAVPSVGAVGGGAAPGVALPGWAVALPEAWAEQLRRGDPAVVARVERGRCLVDLRCIDAADDLLLTEAIRACR